MTLTQFIEKWTQLNTLKLSEKSGYQTHFNDLCEVVGHPKPLEQPLLPDFAPDNFSFEKCAAMVGSKGGHGWADVWKNRAFAFEYKKKGRSLDEAYAQLIRYHDDLNNVPVLATCDFARLHFHIKRTNCKTVEYVIPLENFAEGSNQTFLKNVFYHPEWIENGESIEKVTQRVATQLARIAISMGTPERYGAEPFRVARFLDRVVFTLFAEDCGLLPPDQFKKIVDKGVLEAPKISRQIHNLWRSMATGDDFGATEIRHFNGALFDEILAEEPLVMQSHEVRALQEAAQQDWSEVDPSIFGTLFERALDPEKRSQLGAHYTSRSDIETLIEPVILKPLRARWNQVKPLAENALSHGDDKTARTHIKTWLEELGNYRTLDPACGSGNFLYVALQKMLDLEHQARKWSLDYLGFTPPGRVHPRNFYGIETSIYAHDLARICLWIGYLQWIRLNSYKFDGDPVLESVETIRHADSLFDEKTGIETKWPQVDFIVGNPPFLGGSKIWRELKRPYQQKLWEIFDGRVRGSADLCCYWFAKAREHIADGGAKRAGLVATQAIRGGASREVLEEINSRAKGEKGGIFFAISDRNWVLDGANVHISLVAFDDGTESERELDGIEVEEIHANLTALANVTKAHSLISNLNISVIGTKKAGKFEIAEREALLWLKIPNPHGKPNSDVLRPWINGSSIVQRPESKWIIDPGTKIERNEFELYERPYFLVDSVVRPARMSSNEPVIKEKWWLHARPRPEFRNGAGKLVRYLATPRVSKFRIFVWSQSIVLPDDGVFTFARSDDYFFGILHSEIHEIWARSQGTQVRDRESGFRYTPTTCFETFPLPTPNPKQIEAVSKAAFQLNELRENWLNPLEWTKTETIEFAASAGGPWQSYLLPNSVNEQGIGTARWTHLVPRSDTMPVADVRFDTSKNVQDFRIYKVTLKDALSHRTLTDLYNHPPSWLQGAHRALDEAVFIAYGWPPDLEDEEVLMRLLALNQKRYSQNSPVYDNVPRLAEE